MRFAAEPWVGVVVAVVEPGISTPRILVVALVHGDTAHIIDHPVGVSIVEEQ